MATIDHMGIIKARTNGPVPPLNLQRRFAAIVESIERNRRPASASHLAELDTLFDSLQSRAFRGDL